MKPYIQIIRYPYEEPYHLNLVLTASNGRTSGGLNFYLNAEVLIEWADAMERFPMHSQSVFLWETGSEYPEDRWAYYFRLRLFTVDSVGHSAIQLRFNNNCALPSHEISEFCIESEAAQINRLGHLCRRFAKLKHQVLNWSLTDGELYESLKEAEKAIGQDKGT